MSAHNMHPTFNDLAGYKAWRATWRALYARQSVSIRKAKLRVKALSRLPRTDETLTRLSKCQSELHWNRVMARKTMTLLESAQTRWARILAMEVQIATQMRGFPLVLENCPAIDFHFNKGSIEFPQLPAWVIKAKGQQFFVHHVDFSGATGTTRETPGHASTKGSIRFRRCTLALSPEGFATLTRPELVEVAQAA
jgi:hypothetical protein